MPRPNSPRVELPPIPEGFAVATFAGGCFWCMEQPFDTLDGVEATIVGYTGGHVDHPTYEQVTAGDTGHAEAVWILYDPDTISYEQLLDAFWRQINPTTSDRQFCDIGASYRPAIFYYNPEQRRLAEASRDRLTREGVFEHPIVTDIVPASRFWPGEEYHQDYYRKHPLRYGLYRAASGRDAFLKKVWGKSGDKP